MFDNYVPLTILALGGTRSAAGSSGSSSAAADSGGGGVTRGCGTRRRVGRVDVTKSDVRVDDGGVRIGAFDICGLAGAG